MAPASFFVEHFLKEFYSTFDSILTDILSLAQLLEKAKFDEDVLVFIIDFKSLYTNIPMKDAINSIKELNVILKNSLMNFNREYFQQIFGVIMGTNIAPILY